MPVFYDEIDPETKAVFQATYDTYHQRLADANVTIRVLFAHNSDKEKPAIKVGGYPAYAFIKINNLRQRKEGLKDATMVLDGDQWPTTPEATKVAIIDHELTHLEPVGDLDDAGRPKLKMRRHDYQFGGFDEIAERHKGDSIEAQTVGGIGSQMVKQGVFPGF